MKKVRYYTIVILISTSTLPSFAQTNISKARHSSMNSHFNGLSDQHKLKDLRSIHYGTFQLRVSNIDYSPLLTLEMLTIVTDNRLQSTSQVFEIDEYTTLYLPSIEQIESESFNPLAIVIYSTGPMQPTESN